MDYNTAKDSITIHYYLNSNSILLNIHSGMFKDKAPQFRRISEPSTTGILEPGIFVFLFTFGGRKRP